MRRIRSHLTYANVMATVAVFLVLAGGTALAATMITSNSQVGQGVISGHKPPSGKHANIISGSVNGQDIADNSVTRNDVLESSLGKVPNADKLDGLDSTAFARAQGATFSDAGLPDLNGGSCPMSANGWYNRGTFDRNAVSYYRDPFGIVHLRGNAVKCGTASSDVITLPLGYRPKNVEQQPVVTGADGIEVLNVLNSGEVAGLGAAAQAVILDGVTFRCGPSGQNGCP